MKTTSPPRGASASAICFHELLVRQGPEYLQRFGPSMPARQRQVLQRILRCRTPALGGQLFACPDCGAHHYRYYSCNDRHCPLCGQTEADDWLARQQSGLLLPTPYFLVTFTLPEPLRDWMRSHPKAGYDLLFQASAQALQDLAANPKHLGGSLALLGVLHTWSRTLIYHPHIHYLVPGGGLSLDQRQWLPAKEKFLLPVYPLSDHFRHLFYQALQKHHSQAPSRLAPETQPRARTLKAKSGAHPSPAGCLAAGPRGFRGGRTCREPIAAAASVSALQQADGAGGQLARWPAAVGHCASSSMTLLTSQSNCENAAQAAPRIALLTNGPYRCFLTRPLANALVAACQNGKSKRFGAAAGKQTDDANGDAWLASSARRSPRKHFPQGKPLGFPRS